VSAVVVRGDARALPLPDASVDLIVTSPPYFALRSYTDGGEHYDGQIGSEPTPREYIDALLACTREWTRVLKPSGSIFVNLGDSYYSGKGAPGRTTTDGKSAARTARRAGGNPLDGPSFGVGRKSLVLLPERYRVGCVDELGLIARAVLVWSKPNGLPESVTDRVRRSHEDWVHLTKEPRYFTAIDAIREPHVGGHSGLAATFKRPSPSHTLVPGQAATQQRNDRPDVPAEHPLGKLPGSVWEIATQPLRVPEHLPQHFAAFPTEWPRRIIAGWSPAGICTRCGQGRRIVTDARRERNGTPVSGALYGPTGRFATATGRQHTEATHRTVVGQACGCPDTSAPTRPAVVLDPFGGTGTTALVASVLGRIGVSVDYSADYCRLATWRTTDPGQRARAGLLPKPARVSDGQLGLFES
jgi:DNA modification methylase